MKDIAKGYENSSMVLEQIISNQKPFFNKTGIGYKQNTNEASSSMLTNNEKKPRWYEEFVKDYKNEEEMINPYQKKGQQKDEISEKHLLHMFQGMDTSFMGIALHVEDLDTKL